MESITKIALYRDKMAASWLYAQGKSASTPGPDWSFKGMKINIYFLWNLTEPAQNAPEQVLGVGGRQSGDVRLGSGDGGGERVWPKPEPCLNVDVIQSPPPPHLLPW